MRRWAPLAALLCLLALVIPLLCLFAGCAAFERQWWQAREPSPKPWYYVAVNDPAKVCGPILRKAEGADRILACAVPTRRDCTMYLPKDAPRWIVEHEEKHCRGWQHE